MGVRVAHQRQVMMLRACRRVIRGSMWRHGATVAPLPPAHPSRTPMAGPSVHSMREVIAPGPEAALTRQPSRLTRHTYTIAEQMRGVMSLRVQTNAKWSLRRVMEIVIRTLGVSLIGQFVMLVTILYGGWLVPFANQRDVKYYLASTVLFGPVVGCVGATTIISFLLYGYRLQHSSRRKNTPMGYTRAFVVVLRLVWRHLVVTCAICGGMVALLLAVHAPIVQYNLHTQIYSMATVIYCVVVLRRVIHFRRTRTVEGIARQQLRQEDPSSNASITSTSSVSNGRIVRSSSNISVGHRKVHISRALIVILPTLLSAAVAVAYLTICKQLTISSVQTLAIFISVSVFVKFWLLMLSRSVLVRMRLFDLRNVAYIITTPILLVEIQIRITLMRSATNSKSMIVGSTILSVCEVSFRIAMAFWSLLMEDLRRLRFAKHKHEVGRDWQQPPEMLAPHLEKLTTEFEKQEQGNLRIYAVKIQADMVVEYCAIGFVSMLAEILDVNQSFEISLTLASTSSTTRLTTYLVQLVLEIVSDVIASGVELWTGVPLHQLVLDRSFQGYLCVVIMALGAIAAGISIMSLVRDGDT